jgi:hypothetical protein
MKKRQGEGRKRRIATSDNSTGALRNELAGRLAYVGSPHHKTKPGDYGFQPPVNPRPWKSICDGLRIILLPEARELFRRGILMGMFSDFESEGVPKYVWSVDESGEVYEAKVSPGTLSYKG